MRRTLLLGLGVALALGACSGKQWFRAGANETDLERDRRSCFEESGYREENLTSSRYVKRCLAERGWEYGVLPAPAASPSAKTGAPAQEIGRDMGFDECFERCRSLTDRSKEACFDVCLGER